jgi:hypothetical protein
MKHGIYIVTVAALAACILCGHFAADSYFTARRLKACSDNLAVRTGALKHQAGELEQKLRTLQRAEHFVREADSHGLNPDGWSAYEVNIRDAVTFEELARIVEQCIHNDKLFFKPVAFHVALDRSSGDDSGLAERIDPVVPDEAEAASGRPHDAVLALKGTFLVRH